MTKKELRYLIQRIKENKYLTRNETNYIIKALAQEPSEDAVSRKDLLKIYEDRFLELQKLKHLKDNKGAEDRQMGVNYCINILKELPPVTPRKKGKWIAKENIHGLEKFYECSNCGNHCLYEYVEIGFQNEKTKYCPNCGAEMESEEW